MQNNVKRAISTSLHSLNTTAKERDALLRNCLEGRKMKRKLSVAFILIIVLLLLAVTALAVTALTGHLRLMTPEEGPQVQGCTVKNDTLYMMTSQGFMQWHPNNEAPEELVDSLHLRMQGISIFSLPFDAGEAIMILDQKNHIIWQYTGEAFAEVCKISGDITKHSYGSFVQPVAIDNILYIRIMYETQRELWRIDMATGESEMLNLPGIIALSAYHDGQLLALQRDDSQVDTIIVLDAASSEVIEHIASVPIAQLDGLTYDADNDLIYAVYNGMLSRWSGTEWISLQAASIPPFSNDFCIVGGGYVASSFTGVEYVEIDAKVISPTLVIRGWMEPYFLEDDFAQANPEIRIQRERKLVFTGADVADALEAGDNVDVFYVQMDATIAQLIQDGLLYPLSSSDILTESIQDMLPQIQAVVSAAGTPYAMPAFLSIMLWMTQNDAVEDAPKTLLELLQQDIAWNAQTHPSSMYLASNYNTVPWDKTSYIYYAIRQALFEFYTAKQTPDFSGEAFTVFLETLKDAQLSTDTKPRYSSVVTANTYFMLRGRTYDEPELAWQIIDFPTVITDTANTFPASLNMYVLNPNSSNLDLAIEFLEYVAQHLTPGEKALLAPDTAQPCYYSYALVEGFESLQSYPDSWEVTEEALAIYKSEIAPKLAVSVFPYSENQSLLYSTVLQYLDDEITLEDCITQLNTLAAEGWNHSTTEK